MHPCTLCRPCRNNLPGFASHLWLPAISKRLDRAMALARFVEHCHNTFSSLLLQACSLDYARSLPLYHSTSSLLRLHPVRLYAILSPRTSSTVKMNTQEGIELHNRGKPAEVSLNGLDANSEEAQSYNANNTATSKVSSRHLDVSIAVGPELQVRR